MRASELLEAIKTGELKITSTQGSAKARQLLDDYLEGKEDKLYCDTCHLEICFGEAITMLQGYKQAQHSSYATCIERLKSAYERLQKAQKEKSGL